MLHRDRINLLFYLFFNRLPIQHLCVLFPVGLSLLIQHFQQVLWVLKFLLSPGFGNCLLPKPGDRSNFNTHKTCWKCCINNERLTGQKQKLLDGWTVENKGKLILLLNAMFQWRIHKGSPIIYILSRINPIPYIDTYFFRSILILSSHLCLGLPKGLSALVYILKFWKHSYLLPFWLHELPVSISYI